MKTKWCCWCKKDVSADEFRPNKQMRDGLTSHCKSCESKRGRDWKINNPERVRSHHLKNYGVSTEQYSLMFDAQDGACAICRGPSTKRYLSVDHDHSCCPEKNKSCGGCVRGLLCVKCNLLLGYAEDSVERLADAIVYLLDREIV